ncbi:hypothetical protein GCM10010178_11230 [Lentzea flava]|uniref:DUF3566 domain-containing protein n=1 Tax=Lentzea flava TaxID=103732 RepID=A0ABQ2UCM2_9PSEU|nr:Transmembrane protein of unknown function (DUF3566) [Lentzea flava]GGU20775.1 hypothetical protein GCM10010178_11230 [Lentzea flava]
MTPPENREGRDADKTAVITKPTPQKDNAEKSDSAAPAASGSSGGNAQDKTKPVAAEKAAEAAAPASAEAPAAAPAAASADEKTVTVETPAAPAEPVAPVAAVAEEPVVVSAPPPWQRVTNDTEAAQQDSTEAYVAPAAPPVPPQEPAFPSTDPDTVKVQKPVVTGSAVPVGLGSSRTSVNMGGTARPAAATPSARRPGRGPRRASLQVKRVDPWSVLKLALVLGVALFFVWLVAVGVLYGVLHGMGVWDKINSTANDLLQANEPGEPLISAGRVFGVSAIIGAVNIVLFTALATVGAFVYNVSADLAGGLELTLSERE